MPEKREYSFNDLKECPLEDAPSLDLPALTIDQFYIPKDNGKLMVFFTSVKKTWKPQCGCPFCGSNKSLIRSGTTKPRKIRDVMRNNHCVLIVMLPPRMQCTECKQRFTPNIDGIVESRSMTERLLEFLKKESFLQPHTVLAERSGVSIQTIQNIMDEEIERYEQQRLERPLTAPRVLGIDEKHIVHQMRGTIVDIENGNLLDMLEDNSEKTMKAAIMKLTDWDKNIQVVTTDMANRYISWLSGFLPNATVVIDKFHVIQDIENRMATAKNALYAYRKGLIDNIEDNAERARQYEVLRIVNDNKRLFNYSMEHIVRDEKGRRALKLATVMDEFPEFRLLRMLYYYIEDMYTKASREEAEKVWDEWQEVLPPTGKKAYEEWCDLYSVDASCFETFQSFKRSNFTTFKPYILNYFNPGCRQTNATTEGLNSLIGSINITGNGYAFKHLRAKALYASLIHERIIYTLDIKTVSPWKSKPKLDTMYEFIYLRPLQRYYFKKITQTGNIGVPNVLPETKFPAYLNIMLASRQRNTEILDADVDDNFENDAWESIWDGQY